MKKTVILPVELHDGKVKYPANTPVELDAETADDLVKRHGGKVASPGGSTGGGADDNDDDDNADGLDKLNKAQLLELAQANSITIADGAKKGDIVAALRDAEVKAPQA